MTATAPAPLRAHGDLHEQILALDAELDREPGRIDLLLRRADLHRLHEAYAESAADYDRIERLAPGNAEVEFGRGRMWLDTGALAAAATALDRYLARHPEHVEAHLTRARVRAKQGLGLAAAEDYRRAIALSARPEPEYYFEAAQTLAALQPPALESALAMLDAGLARLGPLPSLGLHAVELEGRLGHHDAALARLDVLRQGAARQETWLERRGDVLVAAGKAQEAAVEYRAAQAALAALPARLRGTRATTELGARIERKLAEIERSGTTLPR